ncbi:hypothetical protein PRZ61_10675 [Halomonas pacifica]|uniref:hypothetical protein n=1 Tax=Bisbaumannia pacifica TaxID=77098 RepID=UPI0023596CE1|nr:hypothetical protein [Halomonas pacifica]MDC8803899.1 hypothetical protein [Halomonas pacifica]
MAMTDPETLAQAVRHLMRHSGSDIVSADGAIYEITARRLDAESLQRALAEIKERDHERTDA